MFVDDLNDSGMDIPDIERAIGFLDEYVVLRVQTTALQALFVGSRKRDFFSAIACSFLFDVPSGLWLGPGGMGVFAVFPAVRQYKERISQWLTPWRKGQDSNLLPSPVLGAAHPHELPSQMCPLAAPRPRGL